MRARVPLLLLLFSPPRFVVISLQIIVAAAPAEKGREGVKIRASDKHRAKRSSASCAAKKRVYFSRRRWRKENVGHFRLGEDAHQKIWGEQNGRRVWLWSAQSRWTDSPRPEESAWMKFGTEKGKNTAE